MIMQQAFVSIASLLLAVHAQTAAMPASEVEVLEMVKNVGEDFVADLDLDFWERPTLEILPDNLRPTLHHEEDWEKLSCCGWPSCPKDETPCCHSLPVVSLPLAPIDVHKATLPANTMVANSSRGLGLHLRRDATKGSLIYAAQVHLVSCPTDWTAAIAILENNVTIPVSCGTTHGNFNAHMSPVFQCESEKRLSYASDFDSFLNHAYEPNAAYGPLYKSRSGKIVLTLLALQDLHVGEELLIDYRLHGGQPFAFEEVPRRLAKGGGKRKLRPWKRTGRR